MYFIIERKSATFFSSLLKYPKSNELLNFCSAFPIQPVIVVRDLLTFLPFIFSCKFDLKLYKLYLYIFTFSRLYTFLRHLVFLLLNLDVNENVFFLLNYKKNKKKPNDQFFTCPSFQFISFLKAFTEVKFKTLVLAQMLKKTH